MTNQLSEQAKLVLDILKLIGDLIRHATKNRPEGGLPSGELYAQLMGKLSLANYTAIINKMKDAGVVKERGHLLIWIGDTDTQ